MLNLSYLISQVAAAIIKELDPNGIVLVLASDHHIGPLSLSFQHTKAHCAQLLDRVFVPPTSACIRDLYTTGDPDAFTAAVARGIGAATKGYICTFGITPEYAPLPLFSAVYL
jgi:mannose-1-phosphate guanylyltransferase